MRAPLSCLVDSCSRFLARFSRDETGMATTLEFAFVAAPFFALLFGIIELGMIFLVSTTLESTTDVVARQIRTGELQVKGGATAVTFASSICTAGVMSWLGSNCAANLSVDVRTFPQFQATNVPDPVSNGVFTKPVTFQPGGPSDIVLVRVFYVWTLIVPGLDGAIQQLNNGQILITSTATFRNEPYQ
jgi:Flp pilus assembly protein TadG